MQKKQPVGDAAIDNNPEWTATDFKKAVRFEGLPLPLQEKLRSSDSKPTQLAVDCSHHGTPRT
jgi:hypothetical protein